MSTIKPNIFICGPSGSGKSSSLENMNPATTGILNTEQKALPFRGAGAFRANLPIRSYLDETKPGPNGQTITVKGFRSHFEGMLASTKLETIVIESFTSLTEMIFRDMSKSFVGREVWGQYASEIDWVLNRSKNTDKNIVFLGIDDYVDEDNGVTGRHVKVNGKAWRGSIEKEFVIVLFTHVRMNENSEPEYLFITQTDGKTSAKSPKGMLPRELPNDLNKVLELAQEYYNPTTNAS